MAKVKVGKGQWTIRQILDALEPTGMTVFAIQEVVRKQDDSRTEIGYNILIRAEKNPPC